MNLTYSKHAMKVQESEVVGHSMFTIRKQKTRKQAGLFSSDSFPLALNSTAFQNDTKIEQEAKYMSIPGISLT